MKIYNDIIQGTDTWREIRLGRATASNFSKILAKGAGKTRKAYMLKLAAERLTGASQESYSNGNMDWGTEHEDEARRHYEAVMGVEVKQVGFIEHSEDVGCSPDGLIGDKGGLELKCPLTTTHIEYIMAGKLPSTYKAQVQGLLWIAKLDYCDFCSYDPRMKSNKMFKIRVYRDQSYIDELQYEVDKFVKELKILVDTIGASPFN